MRYLVIALLIITPFLLILRSRISLLKKTKETHKDENADPKNMTGNRKYNYGENFDEF